MKTAEKAIPEYVQQVASLEAELIQYKNEIMYLKEQLSWFQRQIFGKKSEKVIKNVDERQLFF